MKLNKKTSFNPKSTIIILIILTLIGTSNIVNAENNAPILDPVGNKTGIEGNKILFIISGTDADNDTLNCSTDLPYDSIINCVYIWIPSYTSTGNYSGNITINDSYGGLDYETIWINVSDYPGAIINVTTSKDIVNVSENENFFINITVNPQEGNITAMQTNLIFNSTIIQINSVSEGNLFSQDEIITAFKEGTIYNDNNLILNIWTVITDAGKSINKEGIFVIINATASNVIKNGLNVVNFSLSHVIIANQASESVPYNITNGSILVNGTVITIPSNSWGLFNNWLTYNTSFSKIAANLSNDVTYTYYNSTSGEWESYYIGYSYNTNNQIGKHNSVLGFFSSQTNITIKNVTPSNTNLLTGWNMLYVEGTSIRTLSTIKTNIEASCTLSDIYKYDINIQDYTNTLTESLQPNEGFIVYIDSDCIWLRSDI